MAENTWASDFYIWDQFSGQAVVGDTFDLSTWEAEREEWVQDNQGYREPVLETGFSSVFETGFQNASGSSLTL